MSGFFSSRWVDCPEHVTEAPDDRLPAGFRAAGVAAAIKPSGDSDVGLLVCDSSEATSAARFTSSAVLAAPVLVTRDRCRLDALRAIAVNAGNANAATGAAGHEVAQRMQAAGADAADVALELVAVASTGVIGVQLDDEKVVAGLAQAAKELSPDGAVAFADEIRQSQPPQPSDASGVDGHTVDFDHHRTGDLHLHRHVRHATVATG